MQSNTAKITPHFNMAKQKYLALQHAGICLQLLGISTETAVSLGYILSTTNFVH